MRDFYKHLFNILDNSDDWTEDNTKILSSEPDINKMNLQALKNMEACIIAPSVRMVYKEITENSAVVALKTFFDIQEPELMKDYLNNIICIANEISSMIERRKKFGEDYLKKFSESMAASAERAYKYYVYLDKLLENLMPCFRSAAQIEKFRKFNGTKKEYMQLVTIQNKKYQQALEESSKYVQNCSDKAVGYPENYKNLLTAFVEASKHFDVSKLEVEEPVLEEAPKFIQEPREQRISESEMQRRTLISKANELYNMVCEDWIRDYDKQIPYAMRNEYETFKNGKFRKFIISCKMPLASDASIGMAQNAITQLNGLIENLEDIAERC